MDLAQKIYGLDVAYAKGKSTRKRPPIAVEDTVAVPPELYEFQRAVDLCIDTLFINGHGFLSTVSKRLYYRTCTYCPAREIKYYRSALKEVIGVYQHASFHIGTISADREFKPVLEVLQQEGYDFIPNYASAQEHVPEAERNNRVIKERTRATFHLIPFKALPKTMVICLPWIQPAN